MYRQGLCAHVFSAFHGVLAVDECFRDKTLWCESEPENVRIVRQAFSVLAEMVFPLTLKDIPDCRGRQDRVEDPKQEAEKER